MFNETNSHHIFDIYIYLDSYCPAFFDRIACWPPTPPGIRQNISCPINVFPDADSDGIDVLLTA
jgi:hypothetical protein